MFFALRVSNRIRHAFRACVVPNAIRRDYSRFIDFLDLSPAMAREIALIDSLQQADVGIERAAYEVLRLEYLLAAETLRDTTLAPEIATVCERAALGCVVAAGSLALELGLPGEQVACDFRGFRSSATRHARGLTRYRRAAPAARPSGDGRRRLSVNACFAPRRTATTAANQ